MKKKESYAILVYRRDNLKGYKGDSTWTIDMVS